MKTKSGATFLLMLLLMAARISCAQTTTHPLKKPTAAQTAAAAKQAAMAKDSLVKSSKDYYLELKGNVRQLNGTEKDDEIKPLDSALISIYEGDVPFSEFWTNKKGKCSFRLPLDKNFKIEITKEGFVTKSIIVTTKIPYDKRDVFSFTFDLDIFEEVKGLDVSVLKNPIAKVAYSPSLEGFAYDVNYTTRINTDLKKMYKNYYQLLKNAAHEKDPNYIDSTEIVPKIPVNK